MFRSRIAQTVSSSKNSKGVKISPRRCLRAIRRSVAGVAACVAVAAVLGLSPAAAPTASAGLFGLSPEQEQKLGAQEHPKILQAYGGEIENKALAAYVRGVAEKIIPATNMPNQKWTVTTLDSPIVNAFALPGGYIYISRGLLSLANSEAELAGVIGHEFGHVVARHTSQRIERSNWLGLGQLGVAILTGEPGLANLAGNVGQLYLLNFSRNQEYEADSYGVAYLSKSGFDPYAQAEFLDSLHAQSQFMQSVSGQQQPIEFLSTHPNTGKRVVEAIQAADVTAHGTTRPRNRNAYLAAIDGMTYGDSEAHGYVRGQTFSHPRMRITFTAPQGFKLQNLPDKVVAVGPNNANVQFFGDKPQSGSPAAYLRSELSQKVKVQFDNIQTMKIHGLAAATGSGRANIGNGRTAPLRAVVYAFAPEQYFFFLMLYPDGMTQSLNDQYEQMAKSFRKLGASEAAKLKPRRIRVVTVKPGDSVTSLAAKSAFDDHNVERFRLLNDLGADESLQAGAKVKIVVE